MRRIILFSAILAVMAWHSALPQSISITSGLRLVECPPDGIPEQEACGEDINGGCDMEPGTEYFEPIQCGTAICGTAWAGGDLRDTDWYTLTVTETVTLVVRGQAEFPFELAITLPGDPDPCIGYSIAAIDQASADEVLTIQAQVDPGEVWIRASDASFEGNPCGDDDDDYYITVDCLPCDDFIIIEIQTDEYPEETSWELIERAGGTVVASAGPLSDPLTVHIWQVCADRTLCYDWYIYDSFGDGIHSYGGGYYVVFGFDSELLCLGGEFAYEDVCPDIGTCLPQTGACCIDNICEFTSEEQPCLDAGGTWYEGETCPEFQCQIIDPCENAIFHNGEPDRVNAFVCDRRSDSDDFEAWIVADAEFPDQVRIGGLHWWTVTDYDYDWQQTGDFIILEDAGDQPGTEIYEEFDVPNRRVITGEIIRGRRVYVYTFEVDITLPAGTYWFGMRPVNRGDAGQNFWLSAPYVHPPLYFKSEYYGMPDWVSGCDLFGCVDVAFCITGWEGPFLCEYIPGDCNHNGNPLELEDVLAMIGTYRGSVMPPYECYCPPHGDNFTPTADPNGNCVANELGDVVTEIAAYRGSDTASGCPDCPGSRRLLPGGDDQPMLAPSLKSKTRIRKPSGVD